MTITFHGLTGALITFLACGGLATFICGIGDWLSDRFTADLRHGRVHRRQVRPGARLPLPGGRFAYVSEVWRDKDAGDMALVQCYDGPEDDDWHQPEWVAVRDLVKDAA